MLPKDVNDFVNELDAEAAERAKRVAATNDWLVRWRDDAFRAEIERLKTDPRYVRVAEVTEGAIKALEGWRAVETEGKTSAARYWAREVEPHLSRLLKGPESRLVRDLYREGGFARGGWEQEFHARLTGRDPVRAEFALTFDLFGAREFSEPPPAPVPAPPEDVGTIRQKLNPPLDACRTPQFEFAVGGKADSGVAINISTTGAALNGQGGVRAETQSYGVMGGGAHAVSLVGATFAIPSGYENLSCTATLDIDWFGVSIAGFAGSTASIDVLFRGQIVGTGSAFETVRQLAAIPSPVLCYRETVGSLVDLEMTLNGVTLGGAASEVRLFAGVQAFSAAAGIVGSSAARMTSLYTLKRLCISAR